MKFSNEFPKIFFVNSRINITLPQKIDNKDSKSVKMEIKPIRVSRDPNIPLSFNEIYIK